MNFAPILDFKIAIISRQFTISILGSRCPSPSIQRQEAVQYFEPDVMSLENESKAEDFSIKVVRKGDQELLQAHGTAQETTATSVIEEDHETPC